MCLGGKEPQNQDKNGPNHLTAVAVAVAVAFLLNEGRKRKKDEGTSLETQTLRYRR